MNLRELKEAVNAISSEYDELTVIRDMGNTKHDQITEVMPWMFSGTNSVYVIIGGGHSNYNEDS